MKWGKNIYDIEIAAESGLEFKERVEKLTRWDCEEECRIDLPVGKHDIICNALWKGFLQDSYMFTPSEAPDFCTFVLVGSTSDAIANVTGITEESR